MKTPFYKNLWFWAFLLVLAFFAYKAIRTWQTTGDWLAYINYDGNIKHETTKQGQDKATVRVQQVPVEVFDQEREDSFIAAINKEVKAKNLLEATLAKIKTADTGLHIPVKEIPIVYNGKADTAQQFEYQDKYLTLSGSILHKDLTLDYEINTPFKTVHKWKRPHWWKAKELVLEITPENPKARVDTVRTITIRQPRPKRWSVGPFAGYGFTSEKTTWVVGIGVHYDLVKF